MLRFFTAMTPMRSKAIKDGRGLMNSAGFMRFGTSQSPTFSPSSGSIARTRLGLYGYSDSPLAMAAHYDTRLSYSCKSGLMIIHGTNTRRLMTLEKSGSITHSPLYLDCFNNSGFWPLMALRRGGRSHSSSANSKANKPNSYSNFDSCPPMPFDLCPGGNAPPSSKKVLSKEYKEQGSEMVLRKGMVLLKGYLIQDEQVSIVRECRNLGIGPGGFYWPNRRRMLMCLGLDWDPQTSKYSKRRQFDNSLAPNIPHKFLAMVRRAMISAQAHTERKHVGSNVEDILPMISPDICIVQFYTAHGQLGYHQDRDESGGSLAKGLPIVSISLGDAAEFLYGDVKDIRKAKKVVLESGDVLIFGGPSRHIFHGIQSVIPRTAPKSLLEETGLRLGRLNLTFRQF